MNYTSRPAGDVFQKALRPGTSVEDKLRDRYRQKSRANLSFVSNDHSVLPTAGSRCSGGPEQRRSSASQARVRCASSGRGVWRPREDAARSFGRPSRHRTFEIPRDTGPGRHDQGRAVWGRDRTNPFPPHWTVSPLARAGGDRCVKPGLRGRAPAAVLDRPNTLIRRPEGRSGRWIRTTVRPALLTVRFAQLILHRRPGAQGLLEDITGGPARC